MKVGERPSSQTASQTKSPQSHARNSLPRTVSVRRWTQWVFLLPAINLLQHRLADEVPDSVEVVVPVDDPHEVLVVPPFDSPSNRDLREDLLLGLGQGGRRHGRYMKRGRHL